MAETLFFDLKKSCIVKAMDESRFAEVRRKSVPDEAYHIRAVGLSLPAGRSELQMLLRFWFVVVRVLTRRVSGDEVTAQ